MIIPGSNYWNIGYGREIGDVERDEEGMANHENPGQNMAWLLKKDTRLDASNHGNRGALSFEAFPSFSIEREKRWGTEFLRLALPWLALPCGYY